MSMPLRRREMVDDGALLEGPGGRRHAERDGGAEDGHLAGEASHDRRLATEGRCLHEAGGVDLGDLGIIAVVLSKARHVAHSPIGVVRVDGDLLSALSAWRTPFGINGELLDDGVLIAADRKAAGDPAADDFVLIGADFHPLAAGVSDRTGRFHQQQAGLRSAGIDAPAARFLDQRGVVQLRVEA